MANQTILIGAFLFLLITLTIAERIYLLHWHIVSAQLSYLHNSCDSSNLLYIVICPTCGEKYNGETRVGKTKLRNRVRDYRQHIRLPEYQKLKAEEHLRTCGEGTFKIFPLLQMRSSEIDLRRSYERNFMKKYKTKLNNL